MFTSLEAFMGAYVKDPLSFSSEVQIVVLPMFNRNKTGFPTAVCREVTRDLKALKLLRQDSSFSCGYANK